MIINYFTPHKKTFMPVGMKTNPKQLYFPTSTIVLKSLAFNPT